MTDFHAIINVCKKEKCIDFILVVVRDLSKGEGKSVTDYWRTQVAVS